MSSTKIGQFMIGVGAVIEHVPTGKILVLKRAGTDFNVGHWEMCYGRIDQFEEIEEAFRRELQEEISLTDVTIHRLLRIWHFYRGKKSAETEIYGLTFHCQTTSDAITLSSEHSEYRWVTPQEALKLIKLDGVKQDIKLFLTQTDTQKIAFSNTDHAITSSY